jgi:hypothetical protein
LTLRYISISFLFSKIRQFVMGCKCKNQPVNVPENTEWGPVFWTLLHGLAERAGSAPMPGLQGDEKRAWKIMLTTLHKALACETCRTHLNAYVLANPINIPDNYSEFGTYVRRYLFNVHENVNRRLKKPAFNIVDLSILYKGINLKKTFDVLDIIIKRSIQATAVPILSWTNWSSQVRTLLGMYN